jgi:hypothetical protein
MQMPKILHMEAVVVVVVEAMGATATPLEALLEVVAAVAVGVVAAVPPTQVQLKDSWWCSPFVRRLPSV